MAFSVQMPALGESVTEGTVTRWLKQEGDEVAVDEPLLEVSTDKVDTEIPSPATGVLSKIVVREDETVAVGAELAVISPEGEQVSRDGGDGDDRSRAPADERPAAEPSQGPAERPSDEPSDQPSGGMDGADAEPSAEQSAQPSSGPWSEPASPKPAPRSTSGPWSEPAAATQDVAEPTAMSSTVPSTPSTPSAEQDEPAARPTADTGPSEQGDSDTGTGTPVTMPALGESVSEGTVTRWLKQVGDTVGVDEPLLEVSTDKVDTEIPSPVAGTVLEINVGEDETVQVGAQLAMIGSKDAAGTATAAPAPQPEPSQPAPPQSQPDTQQPAAESRPHAEPQAAPSQQPPAEPQPQAQPQPQPSPSVDGQPNGTPYVTPLVRKLAAEYDVDLSAIKGTGVGGRIRKQDVIAAADAAKAAVEAEPEPQPQPQSAEATAEQPAGAPAPAEVDQAGSLRGRTEKMSRLRQVIAKRMVESLQTSAQLTTVLEVDVTKVARLRERAKRDFEAREGVKLSFLPFFAKAAIEALKQHPRLNASIDSETNEVTYHGAEHLGVAVDTERGLLVPVIHDAGDLNIAGLARRIADLAQRARSNKVTPDDLSGGTFTLTNTGSRGALFDTPIINQPQVAILGTGTVVKRPVVLSEEDGDTIAIRSTMFLALSYDHRLVDGADAARFLSTVKQRLEAGSFEADL